MKKLSLYSILVACLLARPFGSGAQQRIKLQFIDNETRIPVAAVSVFNAAGVDMGSSDDDGYINIAPPSKYFVAIRKGYSPDTIRDNESAVVLIKPLEVALKDVVVSNKKVRRILHSAKEYVVDYDFIDDNILVASYSGNNGRHAKLFLLNNAGDTLALTQFPDEPVSLYTSCVGKHYCVCKDKLYPLAVGTKNIAVGAPGDISLFSLLSQCEQNIDNTFYYHLLDKEAFASLYSLRKTRDTASKLFYSIEQHSDAMGNFEEVQEILAMLQFGNFKGAARLDGMRRLRNDVSYRSLGLPIYRNSDSLVIFDFDKMRINYFEPNGTALPQTTIAFDPGKTFRISILQDPVTGKFYLYKPTTQTLEEIDIRSGKKLNTEIAIRKPFAEKIKVHKGSIYYLWQDEQSSSTRQLFVQSPF